VARYVALLGSINVGGNRIKMVDLKAAFEAEGFEDVATVMASGNVLFDHKRAGDAALATEIEGIVKDRFSIASFTAVRSRAELARAIDRNPFVKDGEERFVHTFFLQRPLDQKAFKTFADGYDDPERLAPRTQEYFADYSEGVAGSKLDPALKKAKVIDGRATARNIRSLKRILEKMDT
jgi:uncharacterized protein (DUF1697 family)